MKLQTSVEFLIILAVALLALLTFMLLTQSETVGVTKTKIKTQADAAVNQLAGAAQDVYSQGTGARKKVTVTIPSGYEWNESYIKGDAIKMRVAGNDHVVTRNFQMYGNLPLASGRHSLWVVSEGEKVRIGTAMISLDQETVNLVMGRNDTRIWRINILNTWSDSITVNIDEEWGYSDVTMALSEDFFILDKGSSKSIILTFSSDTEALGFYPGSLNISSSTPNMSESLKLPLSVEVSLGRGEKDGPPLMAIPSFINVSMVRSSTRSETFQVCTNQRTSLNYVTFSPSINEPGSWIGNYQQINNLEAGNCQFKSITITVPDDAESGNYSGFIYLSGDVSEATDAIALGVAVGGWTLDGIGPEITDITVFPNRRRIFSGEPVTIRATADDTLTGNNSIESCRLKIDDGSWSQMISGDGWFNEPVENASIAFFSGLNVGQHTATVECTDSKGNVGAMENKTFRIMKEFLFVTENSTPGTDEQAWMDWIDLGLSTEGFIWNMDSTDSASFTSGGINTSDYAVLVFEQWDDSLLASINSFRNPGGSVIFLGHSLADAPSALGYSVQSNNPPANSSYVYIVGSHYITQGFSSNSTIFTTNTTNGRFWKDFSGTLLARSPTGSPPHFHVLGVAGKTYFWGPYTPSNFSLQGMTMSSRIFDHAVNSSSGGG
jgi:hypothetical protein